MFDICGEGQNPRLADVVLVAVSMFGAIYALVISRGDQYGDAILVTGFVVVIPMFIIGVMMMFGRPRPKGKRDGVG